MDELARSVTDELRDADRSERTTRNRDTLSPASAGTNPPVKALTVFFVFVVAFCNKVCLTAASSVAALTA